MKDHDPTVIGLNLLLGALVTRADLLATRVWAARRRGLYIAPELPAKRADTIAGNVELSLAYISMDMAK